MNTENKSLSTFQWFVYLLANSIALPIVIGSVFNLPASDTSTLMQRTFFMMGISSFIQAKFGHRFPIIDSPAGSWVSIFVVFSSIAVTQGQSLMDMLQSLETGIMVAGLLLIFLGVTKWVRYLLFLFTPIVSGTFLFILAVQLSGVFVNGMIPRNSSTGTLDLTSFIIAMLVFMLIVFLSSAGKSWVKNYAILIGILFGWVLFMILDKLPTSLVRSQEFIKFPEIFPWGLPSLNGEVLVTVVFFTFLLISNTLAAITAAQEAIPKNNKPILERLYPGIWAGGISHMLSGIFSIIPVVPIPATAGFVKLTKQYRIFPFLSASAILICVSFFPGIVGFLALLPLPVASAALLTTLIEMLGIAIRSLTKQPLNNRNLTIIGVSLLFGIGTMFISPDSFNRLPSIIQSIGSNGLLVGTFAAIFLEQMWKRKEV